MSKYEWEAGEVILPSAEYARVRQSIQAAEDRHKRAVFEATQQFWKSLSRKEQSDVDAYREAVSRHLNSLWRNRTEVALAPFVEEALSAKTRALDPVTRRWGPASRPSRVLAADMGYPTNRTTVFVAQGASIVFNPDRKSVTWEVSENNHAVEAARTNHLGVALFDALGTVKWTGSTGGVISGNDEYHREDDTYGGGANYATGAYGPIGALLAPGKGDPYQDASGKWWMPTVEYGRGRLTGKIVQVQKARRTAWSVAEWMPVGKPKSPPVGAAPRGSRTPGGQGRVGAGRPEGGQFTARHRGEASVNL